MGTSFPKGLVFYSALAAAVYSAIPYKTPWNLLPFTVGLVPAGGDRRRVACFPPRGGKAVDSGVALVLAAEGFHLGLQSYRANFVYPADTRNPYVYAQTSPDYLRLVRRIEDVAALAPDGPNMLVKVVAGPP